MFFSWSEKWWILYGITEFNLFQLVKYNLEKKIREQVSQIRSTTDTKLVT